tara:strand:- start:8459 stop:9217 length:759 start_codon:yes stop_codon:yes gene_type:complete
MKNHCLFLVLLISFQSFGQTNCDDANSYLVSAYSHVKDAYDSNNISHLKYYANRSVESFKLSKKTLKTCGCETALDLADKGIETLEKVEDVETFEDGRFFVKRARDISKQSVIEIDKCSIASYDDNDKDEDETENNELEQLQNEQLKLRQQQEALKLKEAQIKTKLAKQKDKELAIKKEQLILSYKKAIASNVKTYNETLKICDCNNHEAIQDNDASKDLSTESIEAIKNHYGTRLKTLASSYLSQLNLCPK